MSHDLRCWERPFRPTIRLTALGLACAIALGACEPNNSPDKGSNENALPQIQSLAYQGYDRLLGQYVDGSGMVDYASLSESRDRLDAFVDDLGRLDPATFETWGESEQLAFWINAYNAITLVRILDHYPIDRGGIVSAVLYPANSIRQIDGVWTKLTTRVLGEDMTLDHIEHEIIRKEFNEPRIHAAIVCAAKSCPPLRTEAFRADRLDAQLDDQSRRFLGVPGRFGIDREKNVVYLSPILDWFAEDFVRKYGHLGRIGDHGERDSAVLQFARQYVSDSDAAYIDSETYQVEYLKYDWSLNEQP